MDNIEEKIKAIEEEISKTSYNKATSHHIGKLKAKISKLKEEQIKRSSGGSKGEGFHIKKSGDAMLMATLRSVMSACLRFFCNSL